MEDVLSRIDPRLCVQCKAARGLCGIDPCPLLRRVQDHLPKTRITSRDVAGSSPPSLFVGRHGYPKVSVGPMLPPQHLDPVQARRLDDPAQWLETMTIADVVGLRSSLIRTQHAVRVDEAAMRPDRITAVAQELAMAARPADTEVLLRRIPGFTVSHVGEFTAPHGPMVGVERAALTENPRVEKPVQRAVDDTDLRAADAMVALRHDGVDGYHLERILSAGLLGLGAQRRLVPTRWAITATDDILGQEAAARVAALPTIDKPEIRRAEHFGNRFHVLLLPRVWSFELVEVWAKGSFWASAGQVALGAGAPGGEPGAAAGVAGAVTGDGAGAAPVVASDAEGPRGRTGYAHATGGGYYASRLPVLEHLETRRRQASALVLREVTDAYTTPLGVWVVRETCRRAMAQKPLVFEDTQSALRHLDRHALIPWQDHAPALASWHRQRTLDAF